MQKVSHFDELYPARFLKAGEVKDSPIHTIKDVYLDKLENEKGKIQGKGVLSFEGIDQELTLNKTNGELIKAMFGKIPAEWEGKKIQLVKDVDKFGKEEVDCVRIGGSPDIDADMTVKVTYRRRPSKTFVLKSLKPKAKKKPAFDLNNDEQVSKFLGYASEKGWESASRLLTAYTISDEEIELLKAKFEHDNN